jgi:N-acetylmuramoyl-L-alanine amidase
MVERDPENSITNASTVRIAWRDMKVKIGKAMSGKKVTWSMEPLFIPSYDPNGSNMPPAFRGKWGAAANANHRHRFSASEKYGENDYETLTQMLEAGTNANVTITAETTVDTEGYTAIRVNLPPVGFNKAQITIAIEDVEEEIDLIDLEVPAMISIDPGHGAGDDLAGSSANNGVGVNSGVLERDLALSYGLELRDSLRTQIATSNLTAKVLMTRDVDMNITGNTRAFFARDKGIDVHFIIHFNAFRTSPDPRGTLEVRQLPDQVNLQEDIDLIDPIITSVVTALQMYDLGANKKAFFAKDTTTAFDPKLANTANYHPIRAGYCEVEFLTNPDADELITGADKDAVQTAVTDAMRDGILQDLRSFNN